MGYANQFDALPPSVAAAFRADPSYYLAQVPNPFYGRVPGQSPIYRARPFRAGNCTYRIPQYSSGTASGISSSFVPWANSIYNAAQFRVEKRFSQGLQFLVHLRFPEEPRRFLAGIQRLFVPDGRPATTESSARDPNNLRLDRSLSAFSIPQIAQFSFVYQLPFGRHRKYGADPAVDAMLGGWQVNGIYRVDNGLPIQLFLCGGCSVSLPTYGNQYPDLLAPLQVAGTGNLNQYFANPQVAVKPAPYTMATPRAFCSNARMPGTDNLTASLFKQVPLGFREGARLEIRLEAFNVLNRVQFAAPDTNVGDATFGQITAQANQPRQVQVGLKLYF